MKTARNRSFLAASLVGALAFSSIDARAAAEPAPRLVLQITVDQLRGDLPGRYVREMGEGGFRYLMDQGVWFADAHHAHANTDTIVGHAR
jgi:hypothetical protein